LFGKTPLLIVLPARYRTHLTLTTGPLSKSVNSPTVNYQCHQETGKIPFFSSRGCLIVIVVEPQLEFNKLRGHSCGQLIGTSCKWTYSSSPLTAKKLISVYRLALISFFLLKRRINRRYNPGQGRTDDIGKKMTIKGRKPTPLTSNIMRYARYGDNITQIGVNLQRYCQF
jgi:hypothetical protein